MAQDLDQRLPGVRAAMIAGTLDETKARLIVRATRILKTSDAAVVEAQVLPRAVTWSYNRLASELARLVIAADPATAAERHERARQRRVVSMQRREDGMGALAADLSVDDLATVWNALDAHARTSRAYAGAAQGDHRSMGQRRADGLVDLCASYLDGALAGDLEYRAPRTSTGWTTYRPTQPDDASTGEGADEARRERATTSAGDAAPTSDAPTDDTPDLTPGRPDQPALQAECGARSADPSTEPPDQAAPGQPTVVPRVLIEAVLKRLRSTLQRRSMVNVHVGADVVLGASDNPVYLDGYGWTPAPVGRRILSQNAQSGWQVAHTPTGWEWISPHGKIYTTTLVTYSAQTLADIAIAEETRTDLADLVAGEHDETARTQPEARRAAVDAVRYAAHPAPF